MTGRLMLLTTIALVTLATLAVSVATYMHVVEIAAHLKAVGPLPRM